MKVQMHKEGGRGVRDLGYDVGAHGASSAADEDPLIVTQRIF